MPETSLPTLHRPSGNQRKLAALLDQREPATDEVEPAAIDALDPIAGLRFGKVQAQLAREMGANMRELAPLEKPRRLAR
jgi:hypothetical protein